MERLGRIVIEPSRHPESRPERRRKQAASGGGAHQGEARNVETDGAGIRPLVNDDINHKIFHRRVEVLLHRFLHAVNFIDKQHVAPLQVREQACKIGGLVNDRP